MHIGRGPSPPAGAPAHPGQMDSPAARPATPTATTTASPARRRLAAGACALVTCAALVTASTPAVGLDGGDPGPGSRPADPSTGTTLSAPLGARGYGLPVPGGWELGPTTRLDLTRAGVLVHDFVAPAVRWGPGHRGVDLAAAAGSSVLSPGAGTVSFTGVVVDRPLVVVTHPDGLRSTLEPVTGLLPRGAQVRAGEVVGTLEATAASHCAPETCLHWGVRRGEDYLDPLSLLAPREAVILLPRAAGASP